MAVKLYSGRGDAPWALLIVVVAAIGVTAFTAGRAFSSSCSLHADGKSPPPVNISDPRFAARFGHVAGSIRSSADGEGAGGPAAQQYTNMTEHPACAFFRIGEC